MVAAKGSGAQKGLVFYFRANLPDSLRKGKTTEDRQTYPDEGTVSRWMDAEGVPAAALVLALLKIADEGESIDELLGNNQNRWALLDGRVTKLEIWRALEEEWRARLGSSLGTVGERPGQAPSAPDELPC